MFAPSAEEDFINTKMNMLMLMFPQADFNYLMERVTRLRMGNEQEFENFVTNLVETGDYPKRPRVVVEANERALLPAEPFRIEPFDVEEFMLECQFQPERFFERLPRDLAHKNLSLNFVQRRYPHLPEQYINEVLRTTAFDLVKAKDSLENPSQINCGSQQQRVVVPLPNNLDDVREWTNNFKREVQYFVHKDEVVAYQIIRREMRARAIREKEQFECECCFSDEIMVDEIASCSEGHIICIPCVLQFLEGVKQRRYDVSCVLVDYCSGLIPWEAIRKMMSPVKFNELQRRRQMIELQGAQMPDVEFCASCNYGVIPEKADVVIKCPSCGYDTCRNCRAESHVPRMCYEPVVERTPETIEMKRYAEEVLTAKVVRKCPSCQVRIVKDGGCDSVICKCGVALNYGAVQPGKDQADIPACSKSSGTH